MKKILWLFVLIILLSVGAQSSYACFCSSITQMMQLQLLQGRLDAPYKNWIDRYSGVIFTGQVVNIKKVKVKLSTGDTWHNYQVTFKVDRYWRGGDSPEVVVFTGVGGGDCGIRFRKGESYIVFAEMIEGRLRTGICTFTAGTRYAANIIKGLDLGEGRQPTMQSTTP